MFESRGMSGFEVAMEAGATDRRVVRRKHGADVIRERCEFLPPEEAALLRSVYVLGQTTIEVARLTGRPVHQVRSRVRALVRRISTPEFGFVVRARRVWPPTRRQVAEACFLRGLSTKAVAVELKLSPHQVRRHREAVSALFEAAKGA